MEPQEEGNAKDNSAIYVGILVLVMIAVAIGIYVFVFKEGSINESAVHMAENSGKVANASGDSSTPSIQLVDNILTDPKFIALKEYYKEKIVDVKIGNKYPFGK